jgi:RNA polymerase sigma-70 factor (ECF subfamily)
MRSDEDLMTAVAGGDAGAFEQIVLRYQDPVWRVAVRFVGDAAEAQDIAQTVFLKLFESAKRYRIAALFRTYLFRIVNTTCIDHTRKKRTVRLDERAEIRDSSASASDAMAIRERDRLLRNAVDALPLRQRSVIVLRYDAELPIRDIAQTLKTTEKTVERLLARARKSLQNSLIEHGAVVGDS